MIVVWKPTVTPSQIRHHDASEQPFDEVTGINDIEPKPDAVTGMNSNIEKIDETIAALSEARALLTIDNATLRKALLKTALSIVTTSIEQLAKTNQ